MAFKGNFSKFIYKSTRGGWVSEHPRWMFTLTNTSFFGSKQVKAYITDYYQRNSREYPFEAKAGKTYQFHMGTIDWDWCQGDLFILFDSQGKELGRWEFFLKEYAPGECPECHGTKKCGRCKGDFVKINPDIYAQDYFMHCPQCHGTGVCQTCYIPYHYDKLGSTVYVPPKAPKTFKSAATLQRNIEAKNQELMGLNNQLRQYQLQGRNTSAIMAKITICQKELAVLNQQYEQKIRG